MTDRTPRLVPTTRWISRLAPALALLGGCAALGGPLDVTRGDASVSGADAGPADLPDDGSLVDGGVFGALDGSPPAARNEAAFDDSGGGASCFNFVDDDMNGALDCEDPSCASPSVNTACCVASTAEACCDAPASDAVTATPSCAVIACLAVEGVALEPVNGQVFEPAALPQTCGTEPGPGYAPIGSAASHGYMTLPATYDPAAAHLRITGRIGVDDVTDGAVSAAGFGLFLPQGLGAVARPLVGIAASATSSDVRVIVGDRVVARAELSARACGRSYEYALELSPSGTFRALRRAPGAASWETFFADGTYDVTRTARVAMFGQQPNPTAGPRAWVADLVVEQDGCDLLAPARRGDAVAAAGSDHDVTGITVFPRDSASSAYEALVTSGDQVHWMAVGSTLGTLGVAGAMDPFAENIQPTWPEWSRYEDVEVLLVDGVHHVFLAAAPPTGPTVIVHATYVPGASASMHGSLVSPSTLLTAGDFAGAVSVDGPTALLRSGGGVVLAVRVHYADGHTEIRVAPGSVDVAGGFLTESPGVVGRDADGITTDGLVHASQPHDALAFDRDEVADPQLVEIDSIVRVLYAGRRGTRWAIGMIVASPDFTHFAPAGREPVLAPSGGGFDALGVSEPCLVRRAETDWLYYAGSDGARRGVGLATQPVLGGPG